MATTLSYTIPDNKVEKAKEGFLEIYPNTEKKEDGETNKYTDAQWIKEKIRRLIVRDIHRGLSLKAKKEASVSTDDTIVE